MLAGCGGSEKAAVPATTTATVATTTAAAPQLSPYVRKMRALGGTLGKTIDRLYPIDSGTAGSDVSRASAAKVDRARKVVQGVEAQLSTMKPPAKIAADHRHLEAAVAALAAQMAKLSTALRSGDADTFNGLSQLPAVRGVSSATDAMVRAGYDVVG